ncbi:MAG: PTS sugar transporter subunit IIA [Woeseiaceae bacterium]|nr:PTS sugar transporter subunit IIA [Woeseiaceae bacterium]
MTLENIIRPDSVLCNVTARSKKHSLEILSELLTRPFPDISNEEVFAKLVERERLGCTSLDKGIAFPHCRLDGVQQSSGALIKLLEPVDFDAVDGEDVDLVFGLLVPNDIDDAGHAEIGDIAEYLRDDSLRERLRSANSSRDLHEALIAGKVQNATTRAGNDAQ